MSTDMFYYRFYIIFGLGTMLLPSEILAIKYINRPIATATDEHERFAAFQGRLVFAARRRANHRHSGDGNEGGAV
jgi:hypothetical protein